MANKRQAREAQRNQGLGFLRPEDVPATPPKELDLGLFGNLGELAVGTGIVPTTNTDGSIQIGNFKLTRVGLEVSEGVTFDEWKNVGGILHRLEGSIQWQIGDWYLYGEHQWGNKYQSASIELGYAPKTLREYAYVSRNVNLSIRMDKLKFGHHQLVAGKPSEEQQRLLKLAAEKGLSIAALRKLINGDDDPDDDDTVVDDPDPDIAETNRAGVKIIRKAKKWNREKRNKAALLLEETARQLRGMG